jgi:hypothetical protein
MKLLSRAFQLCIAGLLLAVLQTGCSKEPNPVDNPTDTLGVALDPPLDDDALANLLSIPDTIVKLEEIILDNGQDVRSYLEEHNPAVLDSFSPGKRVASVNKQLTNDEQKRMFIAVMMAVGDFLSNDVIHSYEKSGSDPAQTGLGYSYGSKDWDKRQFPSCKDSDAPACSCNTLGKIYGLDCSGMVYVMTTEADLPPVWPKDYFSVANVKHVDRWNTAFKNSPYSSLYVKDMGMIPYSDTEPGDIIFWPKHIGICSAPGVVYQSGGDPKYPACMNNLSPGSPPANPGKGPCQKPLNQFSSTAFPTWTVYRIFYCSPDANPTILPEGSIIGEKVRFKVNGVGDAHTYLWEFEGGTPSVSSEATPEVAFSTEGIHQVRVEVTDDCGNVITGGLQHEVGEYNRLYIGEATLTSTDGGEECNVPLGLRFDVLGAGKPLQMYLYFPPEDTSEWCGPVRQWDITPSAKSFVIDIEHGKPDQLNYLFFKGSGTFQQNKLVFQMQEIWHVPVGTQGDFRTFHRNWDFNGEAR